MKRWLLFLLWWLCCANVQAMTLETLENKIFATGPVGGNDFNQFKDAFENPRIDTVVFVNSPGGDLWTSLRVGQMIEAKGYRTVAVGYCMSACSIMFMGGRERRFGDSLRPSANVIGIHGAHDSNTKQVIGALQPQIYGFYKQMIGDKFNAPIINQALYQMEDAGGFLRIYETARLPAALTYHCAGVQTPRRQCTDYKTENGMTLGVLTHLELAPITLPAAFKEAPMVLGQPLDRLIESMPAYLMEVASRQCVTEMCKINVQKWSDLKENRALATRQSGVGVGWNNNNDRVVGSLVRSVYACNHARGMPVGLCQAEAVNSYDVRWMYAQSEVEHKDALARLKVPTNSFYGNEEFGGGFTKAISYKTQRYGEMTPSELEGIPTIGTQALTKALLSEKPPTLVDVFGSVNDVLPTAKSLINGGLAFELATEDDFFNKRFAALLVLLSPDKNHPIVFYCGGRECWLAVNAAMRAKAAGYTQVQWYRGGYAAWRAAGLPTALIAVTAVVN